MPPCDTSLEPPLLPQVPPASPPRTATPELPAAATSPAPSILTTSLMPSLQIILPALSSQPPPAPPSQGPDELALLKAAKNKNSLMRPSPTSTMA
ncbi:hypothetical protein DXG01_015505, partial [Tephrocybe rancida]